MSQLKLFLFGSPRIELDGAAVILRGRKPVALLFYLALTRQHHRRDALAHFFWPNSNQKNARAGLRRELYILTNALGRNWWEIDRESVGLKPDVAIWVDVVEFRALMARHGAVDSDTERQNLLTQAVELSNGDFLAGFSLSDCPKFDGWQLFEAESLRSELAGALEKLVYFHSNRADYDTAIRYTQRWLALDPIHEPTHRVLMQLYALAGQQGAAQRQYQECVRILDGELSISPTDETTALFQAIRLRRFPQEETQTTGPKEPLSLSADVKPSLQGFPPFDKRSSSVNHKPSKHYLLPHDTPFVGRTDVLKRVECRLSELEQGHGVLILIHGEAGIGKTSFAVTCGVRAQTLGGIFAIGHCYERGIMSAFSPWLDILHELQVTLPLDLATLPTPLGNGPPTQAVYQLMQMAVEHLTQLAMSQPLVLLLDDLHWADQDSLDLLDFLTRHIERVPLLMMVTYRSEEVPRRHPLYNFLPQLQRNRSIETIQLKPFNVSDIALLVDKCHGPCSAELATYLHNRSEGNPLFLVELISDLVERQVLTKNNEKEWLPPTHEMPVPTLLQQLINQRVARLGEKAEILLTLAAVVGEEWELDIVEAVSGWPEELLLKIIQNALAARIIVALDGDADRYRFGHGLFRETLYNQQISRQRRRRHAQIGATLETMTQSDANLTQYVGMLAYHFRAASDWPKALRYAIVAGDEARRRYASHSALQFYEQASQAIQQTPTAVDPEIRFSLYERLGELYMIRNRKIEAEMAFTQMLDVARHMGDALRESHALSHLSRVYAWLDRLDLAHRSAEESLRMAETGNDLHLFALSHYHLGHIDAVWGELDQAYEHLQQAEQLATDTKTHGLLARTLQSQTYLALWTGQYRRAEQFATRARLSAHAAHDALALSGAGWVLGWAQVELGEYEQAQQTLQAGLTHAEKSGERHYFVKLLNTMGYLYNELGSPEIALEWDQRALEQCPCDDINRNLEAQHYSLLNLATDALHSGRLTDAADYLNESARLPQTDYNRFRYHNRAQLLRAELALAHHEPNDALHHIAEATELAQAKGMPKNLLKSWLLSGQALLVLGRREEAVAHLQRAVDVADEIKHGSLRWKTRLRLAQAYAAVGHPNDELCRQAWVHIEAIANHLRDEQLRADFLASRQVIELNTLVTAVEKTAKN